MATFRLGSTAVVKLHDGSALRNLSTSGATASVDRTRDTPDVTAFGATSLAFMAGLKNGTFNIEGPRDQTILGYIRTSFNQTAAVAFEIYPEGETSGYPKISGNCIVTSLNEASAVNDATRFTAACQITGDITDGTA